jgi:hypothetical protein
VSRGVTSAAVALSLLALAPAVALAQAPAPPTPTAPTAPAAPALDSLRMPKVVTAQQGHARFLVGVRLATPAKLTVQVLARPSGTLMQSTTDARARRAGRAYLRVEAVDSRGFQLLKGGYTVRIQATDAQGRVSPAVEAPFTLRLTPPRGQFTGYTIPLWRAFHRQAGSATAGQLVAVVGPRTPLAAAGVRRGDVITSLNGVAIDSPGAWAVALRGLPAEADVTVELVRAGAPLSLPLRPGPDWEAPPDYARALLVATRRDPRNVALAVARARQLVEAGKVAEARTLMAGWPRSWRASAPGQLVAAEAEGRRGRWKQALGAYNRARKADPTMAAAEFGRGLALSELDRTAPASAAFGAAGRLDPADPAAAGFRAYALLALDRGTEAIAEAQRAVRLDLRYADGFLPLGIGLLAAGERAGGVRMLRRGLILLEEPERAGRLIAQHLDPTDP